MPLSSGKVMIEVIGSLDRVESLESYLPEELETARLIMSEGACVRACAQADGMEQSKII